MVTDKAAKQDIPPNRPADRPADCSDIRYGLVGAGRLTSHFARYFTLLNIPFTTWSRRQAEIAKTSVSDKLAGCETILILIKDAAIEPFILSNPGIRKKRLVHCSGALTTELAYGAHPLMTFGPELYDLKTYREIPFILEAGGLTFKEIFPDLDNTSYTIAPEAKAYYHSLCVLGGNFSVILWAKLFKEFTERFNIPETAAHPYLKRVTKNLMTLGSRALTGPLARGDLTTINNNVSALSREGDPFKVIYEAFVKVCLAPEGDRK